MTHTYAVLEVSPKVYQEVRALLEAAGYSHAFISGRNEVIDIHGIALASASEPAPKPQPSGALERSWEGFAEERSGMLSASPLGFARQAFYAGAQATFSALVEAINEPEEEDSIRRMEALANEIGSACEELKL